MMNNYNLLIIIGILILGYAVIPTADAQLGQCGGSSVLDLKPGESARFFWCVVTSSTTPLDIIFFTEGSGSEWITEFPTNATLQPKPIDQPTGFGPIFRLSPLVTVPTDFDCTTTKNTKIIAQHNSGGKFIVQVARIVTINVNATEPAPLFLVKVIEGVNPQDIIDQYSLDGEVFKTMNAFSMKQTTPYPAALLNDFRIVSLQEERIFNIQQQTLPTGIDRIKAQTVTKIVSPTIDVAVIDTGISMTNTDLNVIGGKNFLDSCTPDNWDDDNGHGTHVAGIIGAIDNEEGVVGVAPNVNLWAYKVLDSKGSGTETNIIRAIEDIILRGDIEIINMSLGGFGSSQTACGGNDLFHNVICNAEIVGIKVVVAAGNSNIDARNFIPAGYAEAITVSAMCDFDGTHGGLVINNTRLDDSRATFSNFGVRIDIAAPGCDIVSSAPNNEVRTFSGTSMAAPHVAGALALELSTSISISQQHPFGFSGDVDNFPERLLFLGDASIIPPTPDPEPEPPIPEPPTGPTLEERVSKIEKLLDKLAQFFGFLDEFIIPNAEAAIHPIPEPELIENPALISRFMVFPVGSVSFVADGNGTVLYKAINIGNVPLHNVTVTIVFPNTFSNIISEFCNIDINNILTCNAETNPVEVSTSFPLYEYRGFWGRVAFHIEPEAAGQTYQINMKSCGISPEGVQVCKKITQDNFIFVTGQPIQFFFRNISNSGHG